MTGSHTFEWLCSELEARTGLSKLEARGTVRLILKDVGLDPSSVTPQQMLVVVERMMSAALQKRKVEDAGQLCEALARGLRDIRAEAPRDDAYDVFDRLESDTTRRRR